jgi:hypothetical protein
VFLRFPKGETVAYFTKLRDFPRPWVLTREPDQKRDSLTLSPDLPQFPVGTQVALVRQMLLIDKEGKLATTQITENVQLRVYRAIAQAGPRDRRSSDPEPQDFYEFTRTRALLFADKTGGLRALGRNDKDFRTQLLVHPHDVFDLQGDVPLQRRMGQPMLSCVGCHARPGIFSFLSYTGGFTPSRRNHLPDLQERHETDGEGWLSAMEKRRQYSWGLLRGLWETNRGDE